MAQVNVTISGKTYRMACEDGQEEHLAGMAEQLNQSIEQLRDRFGEIGDQRLTVMAAITLADQNAEGRAPAAAAQRRGRRAWRRRGRRWSSARPGWRRRSPRRSTRWRRGSRRWPMRVAGANGRDQPA